MMNEIGQHRIDEIQEHQSRFRQLWKSRKIRLLHAPQNINFDEEKFYQNAQEKRYLKRIISNNFITKCKYFEKNIKEMENFNRKNINFQLYGIDKKMLKKHSQIFQEFLNKSDLMELLKIFALPEPQNKGTLIQNPQFSQVNQAILRGFEEHQITENSFPCCYTQLKKNQVISNENQSIFPIPFQIFLSLTELKSYLCAALNHKSPSELMIGLCKSGKRVQGIFLGEKDKEKVSEYVQKAKKSLFPKTEVEKAKIDLDFIPVLNNPDSKGGTFDDQAGNYLIRISVGPSFYQTPYYVQLKSKQYKIFKFENGKRIEIEGEQLYSIFLEKKSWKNKNLNIHYGITCQKVKNLKPSYGKNQDIQIIINQLLYCEYKNNFILLKEKSLKLQRLEKELRIKFPQLTIVEPYGEEQESHNDKKIWQLSTNETKEKVKEKLIQILNKNPAKQKKKLPNLYSITMNLRMSEDSVNKNSQVYLNFEFKFGEKFKEPLIERRMIADGNIFLRLKTLEEAIYSYIMLRSYRPIFDDNTVIHHL